MVQTLILFGTPAFGSPRVLSHPGVEFVQQAEHQNAQVHDVVADFAMFRLWQVAVFFRLEEEVMRLTK